MRQNKIGARRESLPDRVGALVEVESFPEVVSETGIDREPIRNRPIVLKVNSVLFDGGFKTQESAEHGDGGDRRIRAVLHHGELTGGAAGEVASQNRLMDVIEAGLEIVAAATQGRRPAEVIFELHLFLLRGLRRVGVLSRN